MDTTLRTLVYNHLASGNRLTSFQAFQEYGITRLSAIIFDLRKNGLDILDCWVYAVNRYGKMVKFKQYYLKKGKAK